MYHNYAQLFNDIDKICADHIASKSCNILCFFKNDTSHYQMIYLMAQKIKTNTNLNDDEQIKLMKDFLLKLYATDKNLMTSFKNVISGCLNINQNEWDEYYALINEHAKVAFDFQVNSGQILFFSVASLRESLRIHDPIEKRIQNTHRTLTSKP